MSATIKILIAGIDVSAYMLPKSKTEDSFTTEVNSATLMARYDIKDAITLASGQNVKIWRSFSGSYLDSEIIFEGKIKTFKESSLIYTINCFDLLDKGNTTIINNVYQAAGPQSGKLSAIAEDIIETYMGMTASVQDSGTVNILSQFICQNAYALERLKALEHALNWRIFYNPKDQIVYFQPISFVTNPNPINVSNLAGKPIWTEDLSEMANIITVVGSQIQTQAVESFAGPTQQITLAKKPDSIAITVGGVLKSGGQIGDTGIDYSVDTQNSQVNFTVSSSTIVATYFFSSPLPLKTINAASVATYGPSEAVFTLEDVTSISDEQQRLKTLLNTYSLPFTLCTCAVKIDQDYGYECGDLVAINDPFTGQTANLPIQKITRNLYDVKDDIQLGNKEFTLETWLGYNLQGRIKKLEEQNTQNITIVYDLVQLPHPLKLKRTTMTRTIQRINDSFILGHSGDNGKLGRGIILEDWESGVGSWTGTDCALYSETGQILIGSKSLRSVNSSNSFKISSTQSFGDLSAYAGVSSGAPSTGTLGLWIFCIEGQEGNPYLASAPILRIGSSPSDYTEITGVKTYTDAYDLQAGWNYFVFRLKNGSTTGTPNWAAVDYVQFSLMTNVNPRTLYYDYFTIGTGDVIALNGLGYRPTVFTTTTTTY